MSGGDGDAGQHGFPLIENDAGELGPPSLGEAGSSGRDNQECCDPHGYGEAPSHD